MLPYSVPRLGQQKSAPPIRQRPWTGWPPPWDQPTKGRAGIHQL